MEILYFAWVREMIGSGGETIAKPAGVTDVAGLIDWLRSRSPAHQDALADTGRLRAALDQRFVPLGAPLGDARELAIFPPVTGG